MTCSVSMYVGARYVVMFSVTDPAFVMPT
jgi:hypothetical protein